jgi:hypothetical protein
MNDETARVFGFRFSMSPVYLYKTCAVIYGYCQGQAGKKPPFFKMKILAPEQLTLEAFSPWLKTKFRVILGPASFLELELVEVNAIASPGQARLAAKGLAQEVFSLVFHGPDSQLLPQRIYSFEHDQMGRFDLFIVPIGQKPGFIQYQALFNRLIKPG